MVDAKKWLKIYLVFALGFLIFVIGLVAYIDPFIHYHKPLTEKYEYVLDNQRSQNHGILKLFDYDAVITGSSMTENFKKTEADAIFGVNCVKVPFEGATFKELNDNLIVALETHPDIKQIIRALDMDRFFDDCDQLYTDKSQFPIYLYNDNLLDDVYYLLNRDVLYQRVWNILLNSFRGATPGITPFDYYSRWSTGYIYGKGEVFATRHNIDTQFDPPEEIQILSEEEKERICANITQNVTDLADQYPDVEFYYFIPPYSAAWWGDKYVSGLLEKQLSAEKLIIELILPHSNIRLFSWNDMADITTNLNHFKDPIHYGEWVNSWMLLQMKEDNGRITEENCLDYLNREYELYHTFDYNSLTDQEDYEDDNLAAELLQKNAQ